MEAIEVEIDKIDLLEAQNAITSIDSWMKKITKDSRANHIIKEAQFWAQRAKIVWLEEGD